MDRTAGLGLDLETGGLRSDFLVKKNPTTPPSPTKLQINISCYDNLSIQFSVPELYWRFCRHKNLTSNLQSWNRIITVETTLCQRTHTNMHTHTLHMTIKLPYVSRELFIVHWWVVHIILSHSSAPSKKILTQSLTVTLMDGVMGPLSRPDLLENRWIWRGEGVSCFPVACHPPKPLVPDPLSSPVSAAALFLHILNPSPIKASHPFRWNHCPGLSHPTLHTKP